MDKIVRHVSQASPTTEAVHLRWALAEVLTDAESLEIPLTIRRVLPRLRKMWVEKVYSFIEEWRKYYLDTTADLCVLAQRIAAWLTRSMYGRWETEQEDLRSLLECEWSEIALDELENWQVVEQAKGRRIYDFEEDAA